MSTTDQGDVHEILSQLSEESSFYGSEDVRQQYEAQVNRGHFNDLWSIHDWNVQVVAAKARHQEPYALVQSRHKRKHSGGEIFHREIDAKRLKSSKIDVVPERLLAHKKHNPYQGSEAALQIGEDVDEFLQRLPPATSEVQSPWIWCANFNADPSEAVEHIAQFKQEGTRLLESFQVKRQELEESFNPPKPSSTIARMLKKERDSLEQDIFTTAKRNKILAGKWMLFPTEAQVNQCWGTLVRSTVIGRLGIAVKVATKSSQDKLSSKSDSRSRVICVYTKNFGDVDDVKRVLMELIKLETVADPSRSSVKGGIRTPRQIWYKPDCFTYLDLMSGNDFKIKPSLYGSHLLLDDKDLDKLHRDTA